MNNKILKLFLYGLFSTSLILTCSLANAKKPEKAVKHKQAHKIVMHKKTKTKVKAKKTALKPKTPPGFSKQEQKIIADYFQKSKTKFKPLPPGIAKNLARGKPLPPGIKKRYLPRNLVSLLPDTLDYNYLIAGENIVKVNKATGIVADILYIADILKAPQ